MEEKIELKDYENATKTSTPLKHQHPKVWYLKWAASLTLILAGWLVVAIAWNDRALIVVNSVALAIFANGIIAYAIK